MGSTNSNHLCSYFGAIQNRDPQKQSSSKISLGYGSYSGGHMKSGTSCFTIDICPDLLIALLAAAAAAAFFFLYQAITVAGRRRKRRQLFHEDSLQDLLYGMIYNG